jgi:hypothetical protein
VNVDCGGSFWIGHGVAAANVVRADSAAVPIGLPALDYLAA